MGWWHSMGDFEFAMASGEMTDAESLAFNEAWMATVLPWLCDGGVFGGFIDWRGYPTDARYALMLASLDQGVRRRARVGIVRQRRLTQSLFQWSLSARQFDWPVSRIPGGMKNPERCWLLCFSVARLQCPMSRRPYQSRSGVW
jgi:hypothetical protein